MFDTHPRVCFVVSHTLGYFVGAIVGECLEGTVDPFEVAVVRSSCYYHLLASEGFLYQELHYLKRCMGCTNLKLNGQIVNYQLIPESQHGSFHK